MTLKTSAIAAAVLPIVCATITSCASGPRYNPDHLGAAQVTNVAKICQNVVGLQPSEPLVDNLWPGDPDPELSTNNYRGCIASLSNSLRNSAAARAQMQADRNCRSKGLQADSSQLATCVLHALETAPKSASIQAASLVVTPYDAKTSGSDDSIPEILRRERLACAEIGLEPAQRAFASCVNGLKDVLSASQMAGDYEN